MFNEADRITVDTIRIAKGLDSRTKRLETLATAHQRNDGGMLKDSVEKSAIAEKVAAAGRSFEKLDTAAESMRTTVADSLIAPQDRIALAETLEERFTQASDKIKEEWKFSAGYVNADVVVVGTGPVATAFLSRLQLTNPNLRVVVLDQGKQPGGTFARLSDGGRVGTFRINNRSHRPSDPNLPSTPGGNGDLLPFGRYATIQSPDYLMTTYPTNAEVAGGILTNLHLAADPVLEMKVVGAEKSLYGTNLDVVDTSNNDRYRINSKVTVFAGGVGEPDDKGLVEGSLAEESLSRFQSLMSRTSPLKLTSAEDAAYILPQVMHTDWLFQLAANRNVNPELFKAFATAVVGVAGSADSALITAEYLNRLAPTESYGRVRSQIGLPRQIDLFGCAGFDNLRNRYAQVADFIAGPGETVNGARTTTLNGERVRTIRRNPLGFPEFDFGGVRRPETYLYGMLATGYKPDYFGSLPKEPVFAGGSEAVATKAKGLNIYFIGSEARIPVSDQELRDNPTLRQFANRDSENVVALWRVVPKAETFARQIQSLVSAVTTQLAARLDTEISRGLPTRFNIDDLYQQSVYRFLTTPSNLRNSDRDSQEIFLNFLNSKTTIEEINPIQSQIFNKIPEEINFLDLDKFSKRSKLNTFNSYNEKYLEKKNF